MKISASILAAELIDLKQILPRMSSACIDFIHLDVMDGHFVPQLSFGEALVQEIANATPLPLDVHLMVSDPETEVPKYIPLKPGYLSFHLEASRAPIRLLRSIRDEGIAAGIALNPATPVEALESLIDEVDLILLMSVEPGYYGQKFLPMTLPKIKKLKLLLQERDIQIEVDGGVNLQNISNLKETQVDIAVAGSACFSTPDINENARKLKAVCQ